MAPKFVDRDAEVARLHQAITRPPQLVVLRGRRRVGKSFLLSHVLEGRRSVYFQADEQPERAHLDLLAREVSPLLPKPLPLRFDDWDSALTAIAGLATREGLTIALDEFQWLKAAQPSLDSIIQRHWDKWQRSGTRVTLILSGSALSLMEQLLERGQPLYGRADYRPLVEPLDYRDAGKFAAARSSAEQRLRRYAVLGGTPQYQTWAGAGRLREVIASRILTRGESLYEEPLHLLREEHEIRDPGTYFSVVRAIATGDSRPSEIANSTQIEVPNLTKMLQRLIRLGYLEMRSPLTVKGSAQRRSIYRISDPFFRFWFRFVFPNRSRLERGRVNDVLRIVDRDLDTFTGPIFEDCCRDWIGRFSDDDDVPHSQELGMWWSRDGQSEIDVVGMSQHRIDLLASCKWSKNLRADALAQLVSQRDELPGAGRARLILFARGFDSRLAAKAAQEEVKLVTLTDLFEG